MMLNFLAGSIVSTAVLGNTVIGNSLNYNYNIQTGAIFNNALLNNNKFTFTNSGYNITQNSPGFNFIQDTTFITLIGNNYQFTNLVITVRGNAKVSNGGYIPTLSTNFWTFDTYNDNTSNFTLVRSLNFNNSIINMSIGTSLFLYNNSYDIMSVAIETMELEVYGNPVPSPYSLSIFGLIAARRRR
jgi:hypothetical protein